jgi:AraC-like DNA-binding protein
MANEHSPASQDLASHQDRPVSLTHFDSAALGDDWRYEAWRENIGVLFDVAPSDRSSAEKDQRAVIAAAELSGNALGLTQAPAQVFSRSQRRIAADQLGLILIQYFHSGGGLINNQAQLASGDMLIIDTEQPIQSRLSDFSNLTLVIPHVVKDRISPHLERLHAQRISGSDPLVGLFAQHLISLWQKLPEMSIGQADAAIRGTLGLVHEWLSVDGRLCEELEPEVSEAMGEAIRRHIEHHLAEPFDVDQLTRRFRISRTQLYRLFAPWSGVASYLRERRLLRSRNMLISPLFRGYSIGAIAFETGFNSEAHFNRAFRARFGLTPGQARNEASAPSPGRRSKAKSPHYPTAIRHLIQGLSLS